MIFKSYNASQYKVAQDHMQKTYGRSILQLLIEWNSVHFRVDTLVKIESRKKYISGFSAFIYIH